MSAREAFEEFIRAEYTNSKSSKVIPRTKGNNVVRLLKTGECHWEDFGCIDKEDGTCDNGHRKGHFKYWVKNKEFKLLDIPEIGLVDALCIPYKRDRRITKARDLEYAGSFLADWRVVVFMEDFWDILEKVHVKQMNHVGVKRTSTVLHKVYECVPRPAVERFVALCPGCSSSSKTKIIDKVSNIIPSSLIKHEKLVTIEGFLSVAQFEIVDMSSLPDGDIHSVGHFHDLSTDFHVLFPLVADMTGTFLAGKLAQQVLAYFGQPTNLYVDVSRDVFESMSFALLNLWKPWNCRVMQGRKNIGSKPQESTAFTIRRKILEKWNQSFEGKPQWSSWLPHIMYNMNTSNEQDDQKSAYERVLNVPPPHKKISMGQQGVPITIKFQINRDGIISTPVTRATTIVYPDQSFNTMNMVVENHETVEADDSRSLSSSDEEEHDTSQLDTSQLVQISLEQEAMFQGNADGESTDVILLQEAVGLKEK